MEKKKWIVITMYDERWDFNFNLSFFEGTVEEFEKDDYFDSVFDLSNKEEKDGCYLYKKREALPIEEEELQEVSDKLETIRFECIYLIPVEKINEKDFLFCDGIVSRNKKYGFLDIKK